MKITKEDVLVRIIDLKNLLVFRAWYEDVMELYNRDFSHGKRKVNAKFEARAAMTDLFYYGLLCFPAKWTTFSSEWLKGQLKNFRLTFEPWLEANGYKNIKQYRDAVRKNKSNKKSGIPNVFKHYKKFFQTYILAIEDDECPLYKQFKDNKITAKKKRRILKQYLALLNSYEDEKIPLLNECKEMRLIIYSMLN